MTRDTINVTIEYSDSIPITENQTWGDLKQIAFLSDQRRVGPYKWATLKPLVMTDVSNHSYTNELWYKRSLANQALVRRLKEAQERQAINGGCTELNTATQLDASGDNCIVYKGNEDWCGKYDT